MRRLLAIAFIWLCTAGAWAVLGTTLAVRSGDVLDDLESEVHALWGPPQQQLPPSAVGRETHREMRREQRYDEKGQRYFEVERMENVTTERNLPLDASRLEARLELEHRRKGLLWFPTYAVRFDGLYTFRNDGARARRVEVAFPLAATGVSYEGFAVTASDGTPVEATFEEGRARFSRRMEPGASETFRVAYRTRGTSRWGYGAPGAGLGPEVGRARGFQLQVETNFPDVDFPAGTLSPSEHGPVEGGWRGTWRFDQIVGTAPVGIELPRRLNPGPLAAKITFFAPAGLLFFFFVNAMLLAARRRSIHPVNYFLLACGFFAFHLLFAYLIDHLEIGWSFLAASMVSVALVVSYARLFVGWRVALLQMGLSQLVYLVLFSFTFFWKGFTGLAVAVGAVLTQLVVMQITGRLDWGEVLARGKERGAGAAG
ncbi:MAG TPA: inner membrane CreD family protein [Anaeromyxobacteraceae bacterium]|nr:inner membrane CreD family protein [Anaeromyxobacteraceae bacterium]